MKITKSDEGWWVTGLPHGDPPMGPYDTKAEATEDKQGVERFYQEYADDLKE